MIQSKLGKYTVPLVLFTLASLLLLLLIHLTDEIIFEKELLFDQQAQAWVATIRAPWLTVLMQFFTFLGSFYFLVPCYIFLAWRIFLANKKSSALLFTGLILFSGLLVLVAKLLFHRNRPGLPLIYFEKGYSYPSGHATSSVIFFCWLLYFILRGRKYTWLKQTMICTVTGLLIGAIGFSRVYLNVHFATDVLAGFFLGALYFLLSVSFMHRYLKDTSITY